jgi:hypothetical protein
VRLTNSPPATDLLANWIALDVEDLNKENYIFFTMEGTSSSTKFTFTLNSPDPWPLGEYRVEIYSDGVLKKSADFLVE